MRITETRVDVGVDAPAVGLVAPGVENVVNVADRP